MEGNGGVGRPRSGRIAALALLIVASFVVLSVRLYDVQILQGDTYRELAEQNRLLRLPVPAPRGLIFDRDGVALARNIPGFSVRVLPADLPKAQQAEVTAKLALILGLPEPEVRAIVESARARAPYEPVTVTRSPVGRDTALLVDERLGELPGVRVETDAVREYVAPSLYAPILGYIGPLTEDQYLELRDSGYLPDDRIGQTGVEATYETFLRGTNGVREVERDAAQREIRELAVQPPVPGGNLVLTIDDKLQKIIASELQQGIADNKMTAGVGIAMNPKNGEILAMVSTPTYDDNAFIKGVTAQQMATWNADPNRPLVNKAIGDIFPPGSTFKLVTGLAALNEGVANRNTVVNVTSTVLSVNGYNFYDWRAHGPLDFLHGFAHSSDIYFYTLGGGNPYTGQRGVGADQIARYGRMLGFGSPSGIDLPGEAAGIMPDPQWKLDEIGEEWTIGNTYHMAIGQGYDAVTPLQLLQAYATVANGGTVYRPHVLKQVTNASGEVVFQQPVDVVRRLDVNPDNLRLLREAARLVVTIGHAWMPNAKLPIAGKTGTAEFGTGKADATGKVVLAYHNWFVSFLPKDETPDPTADIAMVIFAYNSSEGCDQPFCANPAVAITQRVYEQYLTGSTDRPKP